MVFAYIIKAIAELATVYLFLHMGFDGCPCNKYKKGILSALFLGFMVFEGMLTYPVERDRLIHVIAMLAVTFAYRVEMVNRVLAAAFTFCCSICGQGIVFLLANYTLYRTVEGILTDLYIYPLLACAASILQFIIATIVCKVIEIYRAHPQSIYTSIFLIAFCLSIMALEMFVTLHDNIYMPATIMTLFLVLFCIGLCIGLVRDQMRVQEERRRLEFLEKHNADQVEHYTAFYNYDRDVHKLRHDLKNFVIGAQHYLQQKEYEKLDAYFNSFLGNVKPAEFIDTGNPMLDAVITAKRADAPHIPFEVVMPPLCLLGIDPLDVAMLLATALDNAIEGCAGYPTPYILIQLTEQGRMLSMRIENPTNRPVVEKKNRLVTQKKDTDFHGYGIPEMQRIAGKYQGHLGWKLQSEVFSLHVLLQSAPMSCV